MSTANTILLPKAAVSSRFEPAYLDLFRRGVLAGRVLLAQQHLEHCDLCARYCRVNRRQSARGAVCRTDERVSVYSCGPHHGEEDCLRGRRGSGTIFFSWCSLRCVYCQNWEISWEGKGCECSAEALAHMMLQLQDKGCHNINLVTRSHVVAQILESLLIAADGGLCLPLVYNTGGCDSPEALALLDGVIDIYMPDVKYGDDEMAHAYTHVRDYVRVNQAAVKEMRRQVGDLVLDRHGIAQRGLLVRHLVLPNGVADTERVLKFVAEEVSTDTHLNLMGQYQPCYRAANDPELDRPITSWELREAAALARRYGLARLDHRSLGQ